MRCVPLSLVLLTYITCCFFHSKKLMLVINVNRILDLKVGQLLETLKYNEDNEDKGDLPLSLFLFYF